jgi:hypothetical protein
VTPISPYWCETNLAGYPYQGVTATGTLSTHTELMAHGGAPPSAAPWVISAAPWLSRSSPKRHPGSS